MHYGKGKKPAQVTAKCLMPLIKCSETGKTTDPEKNIYQFPELEVEQEGIF
jgi:hypothetical protein